MTEGREKGITLIGHNGVVYFGISVARLFRHVANWL